LIISVILIFFFVHCASQPRAPLPFPTRRSSDLGKPFRIFRDTGSMVPGPPPGPPVLRYVSISQGEEVVPLVHVVELVTGPLAGIDRKSTRLNSSHQINSYAVFCLKNKQTNEYCT